MPYLDSAPTRPIPLASWHGTKGRNRGCGRKTSGAAPHCSPDSGCGRTRSGDCHSLNIGTYVLSSGLLLSFKLFEKQMAGEMAGQGGNFAARAAPGLDIRREIVYFGYFT